MAGDAAIPGSNGKPPCLARAETWEAAGLCFADDVARVGVPELVRFEFVFVQQADAAVGPDSDIEVEVACTRARIS